LGLDDLPDADKATDDALGTLVWIPRRRLLVVDNQNQGRPCLPQLPEILILSTGKAVVRRQRPRMP